MTRFGVTGISMLLTEEERDYVHRIVKRTVLPRKRKNVLVSGMAFGVDTEALLAVWGLLPFENMVCVVPGTCNHNRGLFARAAEAGAQLIVTPNLHTVGETYLHRDDVVVENLDVLMAFPKTPSEILRSGTWATVRRARKANKKVRYYPLTNS